MRKRSESKLLARETVKFKTQVPPSTFFSFFNRELYAMQINNISYKNYGQSFNGKFIQTPALKQLRASISKTENTILDKQFQLIEKVKDGKVFGYETFPKDELGNSSRIYEIVNLKGKEYKCTKVAAPKEDYQFLFNEIHKEYRYNLVSNSFDKLG